MYIDTLGLETSIYQFYLWKEKHHAELAAELSFNSSSNVPSSADENDNENDNENNTSEELLAADKRGKGRPRNIAAATAGTKGLQTKAGRPNRRQRQLSLSVKYGKIAALILKEFPKIIPNTPKKGTVPTGTTSSTTPKRASSKKKDSSDEDDDDVEEDDDLDDDMDDDEALPELYERYYIASTTPAAAIVNGNNKRSRVSDCVAEIKHSSNPNFSGSKYFKYITDEDLFSLSFAKCYKQLVHFQSRFGHCRVGTTTSTGNSTSTANEEMGESGTSSAAGADMVIDAGDNDPDNGRGTGNNSTSSINIQAPTKREMLLLEYWISRIRTSYQEFQLLTHRMDPLKLSQDRVDLLNQIGFEWTIPEPPKPQVSAETMNNANTKEERSFALIYDNRFEQLVQFKRKFGHTLVPRKYKEDKAFGEWVHLQRKKYRKGILKTERIARLNAIGFLWDATATGLRSGLTIQKRSPSWQQRLAYCISFKKKYNLGKVLWVPPVGHPLPDGSYATDENERDFIQWAQTIRNEYQLISEDKKSALLNQNKVKQLEDIGFSWDEKMPTSKSVTRKTPSKGEVNPTSTTDPFGVTAAWPHEDDVVVDDDDVDAMEQIVVLGNNDNGSNDSNENGRMISGVNNTNDDADDHELALFNLRLHQIKMCMERYDGVISYENFVNIVPHEAKLVYEWMQQEEKFYNEWKMQSSDNDGAAGGSVEKGTYSLADRFQKLDEIGIDWSALVLPPLSSGITQASSGVYAAAAAAAASNEPATTATAAVAATGTGTVTITTLSEKESLPSTQAIAKSNDETENNDYDATVKLEALV